MYRQFNNKGKKINYFDESKAVVFLAEPFQLRNRYSKKMYDINYYQNKCIKGDNIKLIKVKIFNMHMNRSPVYNQKSYEEDKGWMIGLNGLCTSDNSFTWKDIQLTFENDYDYAVILDQIFKPVSYINPKKSILFRLEPKTLRSKYNNGVDYVDESKYMKVYYMCPLWGWTGLSYNQFTEPLFNKTNLLSTIMSSNQGTQDHIKRLNMLPYLNKIDNFDFYGDERNYSGIFSKFSSYKGKIETKKEGLCSYKYTFAAENCREPDYFSEKLIDGLLCECLVFYSGCTNLESYINKNAFIRVNIDDYEQVIFTIKRSMRMNEWEKRIDIIKQEKQKIVEKLNPLELIFNAVHGYKNYWE